MGRDEDEGFGAAVKAVAVVGAVMTVVGAVVWGVRVGVSVAAGAGLATSNLWVLGWVIRSIFRRRGGAGAGVVGLLKMFALFGGVWILLKLGVVDPLPLVVGYGALPVGICVSSLVRSRRRS